MFLMATFLLLASISTFAQEVSRTVTLAEKGTLAAEVSEGKNIITNLTVVGPIGSDDITTIHEMTKDGALSVLDLSGATADNGDLIGKEVFEECAKLTSVRLPKNIKSIGNGAFSGCINLKTVVIPDGVTIIDESAFNGCPNLSSVNIPDGVTKINEMAFACCSSLTSIDIPESVTCIDKAAFFGCSGLTSVVIPDNVTTIEATAFADCTSLTSVVIGSSVNNISFQVFSKCTNLSEVTLKGTTLPVCANNTFEEISATTTLYCPTSLIETCKATEYWKDFTYVLPSDFSVSISDNDIATGCYAYDLDFSKVTDVKAYIVAGFSPSKGKVLLTSVSHIPAGTGFIMTGKAGDYVIPAAATDYTYANLLVGSLEGAILSATDGTYTNYVLGNDGTNGVGFYTITDRYMLKANKAYLRIPTTASSAKNVIGLSFDDEDETTGFMSVKELAGETNGKTVIYNLNGQRMKSLTKGVNIVNGKKIIMK